MTTDTPRTDAIEFRHCPPQPKELLKKHQDAYALSQQLERELDEAKAELAELWSRFDKQMEAEAEVERLAGRMKEAEDLIKGLHDGWKKARKAHLETCKNAQAEIDKLHAENVCLQEFYEWSRRDYPTEAEVREIMNRYHNLLNK
jgi:hypothetical protein